MEILLVLLCAVLFIAATHAGRNWYRARCLARKHWTTDPDYPLNMWRYEVFVDSTRLGYWEWVEKLKDEKDAARILGEPYEL